MLDKSVNKSNGNKQADILAAAEAEFMEKGFDGAKTTSIALRAGVTHAMLHYYYRTKQNLFETVLDEKLDLMVESIVVSFLNTSLSLEDRIILGIRAHFDFLAANPELPRFVVNELVSKKDKQQLVKDRLGKFGTELIVNIQKGLDEKIKEGKFKSITALDLIIDIVSMNVFPFITLPIIMTLAEPYYTQEEFLANRREEVVRVIMNRLSVNNEWKE